MYARSLGVAPASAPNPESIIPPNPETCATRLDYKMHINLEALFADIGARIVSSSGDITKGSHASAGTSQVRGRVVSRAALGSRYCIESAVCDVDSLNLQRRTSGRLAGTGPVRAEGISKECCRRLAFVRFGIVWLRPGCQRIIMKCNECLVLVRAKELTGGMLGLAWHEFCCVFMVFAVMALATLDVPPPLTTLASS